MARGWSSLIAVQLNDWKWLFATIFDHLQSGLLLGFNETNSRNKRISLM